MAANPKNKRIVNEALLDKIRAMDCAACGVPGPSDPAHIRSRGAGGHDEWNNVLPLCRPCHTLQHSRGFVKMIAHFPKLASELRARGFEIVEIGGFTVLRLNLNH